ncbi:MAG: TonB family protein [Bacteroidetes bacterium]|nr:TonB family protein [Bacteroidota bacterium]
MLSLTYLLQVCLYSGIFWLIYWLLLSARPYHRWNRGFLLFASVFSIFLPFAQFQMGSITPHVMFTFTLAEQIVRPKQFEVWNTASSLVSLKSIYWGIAISIAAVYLFKYVQMATRLWVRSNKQQIEGITVFRSTGLGPGSFWNSIFFPEMEIHPIIFQHEAAHIRCGHHVDLLLLQLLKSLFWFNPFVWLFLKEMKMVHEFEADQIALKHSDSFSYAQLLLSQTFNTPNPIGHSFFNHPIKRRIFMLHQSSNRSTKILVISTYIVLLSAVTTTVVFAQQKKAIPKTRNTAKQQTTTNTKVYRFVDQMPKFPGDMMAYFSSELHYPDSARAHNQEGRAMIEFTVSEVGKVEDPKIVRSSGFELLDKEAIRVVQKMPNWLPGKQKGKNVAVYFTLPLTFKLQ